MQAFSYHPTAMAAFWSSVKRSADGTSSGYWGWVFRLPSRRWAGARPIVLRIGRTAGKGSVAWLRLRPHAVKVASGLRPTFGGSHCLA